MRITIVSGHYGVGKSEFTIALASKFRSAEPDVPITVIDLDVVNPYFRTREARAVLEALGTRVIGNSLEIDVGVDVPAIPGSIVPTLHDTAVCTIIDLGGDPVGARALRQFRPHIPPEDTDFFYLVNAYRNEVSTVEKARLSLGAIEGELELKCTGIVNNTHLLHETTCDHLRVGDELCRRLAAEMGIPVVYHAAAEALLESCGGGLAGEPVVIRETLRQGWMKSGNAHIPQRPQGPPRI